MGVNGHNSSAATPQHEEGHRTLHRNNGNLRPATA